MLREATLSSRILERRVMISSVIPSLKYSFSGSALMLWNGRTAIDLTPVGVSVGFLTCFFAGHQIVDP